jgi:hypothetical protein
MLNRSTGEITSSFFLKKISNTASYTFNFHVLASKIAKILRGLFYHLFHILFFLKRKRKSHTKINLLQG